MFERYIKRQLMKRKYGTSQISSMWKQYQFKKLGGLISKIEKEKLSPQEIFAKIGSYLKRIFKKKAAKVRC